MSSFTPAISRGYYSQPPITTVIPGQFGSTSTHLGHFARSNLVDYGSFSSLGSGLSDATARSSTKSSVSTPTSAVSRNPLSLTAYLASSSATVPSQWSINFPPSHRATPALLPSLTAASSSLSTSSSWESFKAEAERNDSHSAGAYNKRKSNDLDVKRRDHYNSKHNSGRNSNKSDDFSSERHKEHHTNNEHAPPSSSSHVNSHLRNNVNPESKNKDTNNKISNKRETSRSPVNDHPSKLSKYHNNSVFNNKIHAFGEKVNEEQKQENGLINPVNERHDKPSRYDANEQLNK